MTVNRLIAKIRHVPLIDKDDETTMQNNLHSDAYSVSNSGATTVCLFVKVGSI